MIADKPNDIVLSIEDKGMINNIKNNYPNLNLFPDEYIYEYLMHFDHTKDKNDKCRQNIAEQLIRQEEAARLEELRKKEAEERLKEELKKKAAEERLREELRRKEAEERHREELRKKEAEERLREELRKKEAEERLREKLRKKEAEERLREELKKKEAEERLREELRKKEAEENLRKQEEANRIIEEEKANQLKFRTESSRNPSKPFFDSQNDYERNVDDIEEYDSNIFGQPTQKKIEEVNKKPGAIFQSTNAVNFNEHQKKSSEKKIKPSPVIRFDTEGKKPGTSNENYMKYMINPESEMYESSDLIKKNTFDDSLKNDIDNLINPYEYFKQKSSDHIAKPEKIIKTEPKAPMQKKIPDKKSEKLIEEEIKNPLNIKKYQTHSPKHHNQNPNHKTPPIPASIINPASSNLNRLPKSSVENQLEELKRKQNEKFKSKDKYPYKSLKPRVPYEFKNINNPHIFYNPKEPIPSLYYQEDLTYEQLVELDIKNYDEGNGYPPSVIAKLNQIPYLKNCEEKEACPICMDEFERENIVSYLNCGHTFHYNCLANWLSRRKKCPVGCNIDLDDFFNGD